MEKPLKSLVRMKAFVLLGVSVIGILQLLSFVPWEAEKPMALGGLLLMGPFVLILDLTCENCGFSIVGFAKYLEKKGYSEQKSRADDFKKSRLFAFRKHCDRCGLERY